MADVEIVVQWRATCGLCSLWQRFGRAARGLGKEGIAVLLVEKKYLDAQRTKAAANAEKRRTREVKRKAEKELTHPRKRIASENQVASSTTSLSHPTTAIPVPEPNCIESDQDDDDTDEEPIVEADEEALARLEWEQRRIAYYEDHRSAGVTPKPQQNKTHRTIAVGSPVDDLINAEMRAGLQCRRKVIELYFGNDKTGESIPLGGARLRTSHSHARIHSHRN